MRRRLNEIALSPSSTLVLLYILISNEAPCALVRFLDFGLSTHVAVNGRTSPERRGEAKCNIHLTGFARSEDWYSLPQGNRTLQSAPSSVCYLTCPSTVDGHDRRSRPVSRLLETSLGSCCAEVRTTRASRTK